MANEKITAGDGVHLVHANGKHFPAKVRKLRGTDKRGRQLVDLEADLGGEEPVVITSSPLDATGTQPDSWHPVEEEPKVEAKADPGK